MPVGCGFRPWLGCSSPVRRSLVLVFAAVNHSKPLSHWLRIRRSQLYPTLRQRHAVLDQSRNRRVHLANQVRFLVLGVAPAKSDQNLRAITYDFR